MTTDWIGLLPLAGAAMVVAGLVLALGLLITHREVDSYDEVYDAPHRDVEPVDIPAGSSLSWPATGLP